MPSEDPQSGLSKAGLIALICVGTCLVVGLIAYTVNLTIRRRRRHRHPFGNQEKPHPTQSPSLWHRIVHRTPREYRRYHNRWTGRRRAAEAPRFPRKLFNRLISSSRPCSKLAPTVKLEDRMQSHADPKVFSWFEHVEVCDEELERGNTRRSLIVDGTGRTHSVWVLTDEEMEGLDDSLDHLRERGRQSVVSLV